MGSGHVSQYGERQARSLSHPSPLVGDLVLHPCPRLSHSCMRVDPWRHAMIEGASPPAYHVVVRRFSSLLADARENQLKGKRNPLWLNAERVVSFARRRFTDHLRATQQMPLKRQNRNGVRPGAGILRDPPL
jgi:hypothetical protein